MKKKILVIPGQGFAHVTRSLKLAEALQSHYDTKTILNSGFAGMAEKLGLEAVVVDHKGIDYSKINSGNFALYTADDHVNMAQDYRGVMDDFNPDIAMFSGNISARLALDGRDIRTISINDALNIQGLKDGRSFPKEVMDKARNAILGPYNEAAKILGANEIRDFPDMLSGDLVVLPDLPSLFPGADSEPRHVYIGPLTWSESGRLPSEIQIDRNKPLVYVSMGSSGSGEHMSNLARALRESGHQTVITTGNINGLDELRSLERPGFYVRDFLSGDQVIKSSDKTVVVCHGGLGTLYQALQNNAYGLIVSPAHVQHQAIAKVVSETGLGKVVKPNELEQIPTSVNEILASPLPPIRAEITRDLKTYKGPETGRNVILSYFNIS